MFRQQQKQDEVGSEVMRSQQRWASLRPGDSATPLTEPAEDTQEVADEITDADLAAQRASDVETLLDQIKAAVRQKQQYKSMMGAAAAVSATFLIANLIVEAYTNHQPDAPLLNVGVALVGIVCWFVSHGSLDL